jgi:hypothetical protein
LKRYDENIREYRQDGNKKTLAEVDHFLEAVSKGDLVALGEL